MSAEQYEKPGKADIQSMHLKAKPRFCGFLRSLKGLKTKTRSQTDLFSRPKAGTGVLEGGSRQPNALTSHIINFCSDSALFILRCYFSCFFPLSARSGQSAEPPQPCRSKSPDCSIRSLPNPRPRLFLSAVQNRNPSPLQPAPMRAKQRIPRRTERPIKPMLRMIPRMIPQTAPAVSESRLKNRPHCFPQRMAGNSPQPREPICSTEGIQ